MKIRINSSGAYIAGGEHCKLKGQIKPPSIIGKAPMELKFKHSSQRKDCIGDLDGIVQVATSIANGIQLRLEAFQSDNGRFAAVRMGIVNYSQNPLQLHELTLLSLTDSTALSIGEASFNDWRITRMARNKNDIPSSFRPSRLDEDYEDVAMTNKDVKAGDGVGAQALADKSAAVTLDCINSEPCVIIMNDRDVTVSGMFIGILGQNEHLTSINIIPKENRKDLQDLSVLCEFDDVLVSPLDTRWTHWLLIAEADDEGNMLREYAELLAAEYKVPYPKSPLAVYCSWYYYARGFDQADLNENVDEIVRKSIPIDAFVIDNGWMDNFGTYNANDKFSDGMAVAADKIKSAGIMPGIWTCPFMIHADSSIALEHPEIAALDQDGNKLIFPTADGDTYIVDPTVPYAKEYYNELFSRLKSWGYTYHKLDYLRCVVVNENIRFHDPKVNRAQAYRMLLEMIRDALGEECYIAACGGIYDAGNIGLVDSYRTSADVRARWHEPMEDARKYGALIKIKQNVHRNYTNRFWNTDPDATMIRLRDKPFKSNEQMRNRCYLSEGYYSNEEAFTVVVNQYLGGGNASICERFADLQPDRLALLRHIIPAISAPACILDYETPVCPSLFLTEIQASAESLDRWWTLTVGNWGECDETRRVDLSKVPLPENIEQVAIFEFRTQTFLGVQERNSCIEIDIPSHGVRVLRLAPWDGKQPVLLGTDLHLSGGGCEIADCRIDKSRITGVISTPWKNQKITITAGFPTGTGNLEVVKTTISEKSNNFELSASFATTINDSKS